MSDVSKKEQNIFMLNKLLWNSISTYNPVPLDIDNDNKLYYIEIIL